MGRSFSYYLCCMNALKKTLWLFISLALTTFSVAMNGQEKGSGLSFYVQNFSVEDYKGSCQNWNAHVSSDGILYIANNKGLLVFDGNIWRLYVTPLHESIYEVAQRNDTIFTVGDQTKGYWLYNEYRDLEYHVASDDFHMPEISNSYHKKSINVPDEVAEASPTDYVHFSQFDVVGTENNGLYFLDESGQIIQHLYVQNQLQDNCVHAICVQDESRLWLSLDNGIALVDINPPVSLIGRRSEIGKVDHAGIHNRDLYVHSNLGFFRKSLDSNLPLTSVQPSEAEKFINEKVVSLSLSPEKIFSDLEVMDYFKESRSIYPAYDNMYWVLYENEMALFQEDNHQTTLKCRLSLDNFKLNFVTRGPHCFTLNDSLCLISTMQGALLMNLRQLLGGSNNLTLPRFNRINYKDRQGVHSVNPDTTKIRLAHGVQEVNFYVGSTVFTPYHLLSYRLDGISDKWSEWQEDGKFSFSYLPEGTYTLRIRKYVSKGTFPEITMTIEVQPAWYNTIWAYLVYILLMWLVIQQLLNYNLRHLKREENEQKELADQEENHQLELMRQKMLEEELQNKNTELVLQTSALVRRNQAVHSIMEEFEAQKELLGDRYPNKMYKKLHQLMADALNDHEDWKLFEDYFKSAHRDFLEKLQQKYSDLTPGDLRICCLLRMNLSTKEIALLLNVSVRAVELRRYRLRKRLGIGNDVNLVDFLIRF